MDLSTLFGRRQALLGAPRPAVAAVPKPILPIYTPTFKASTFSESQGLLGGVISFFFYLSLMAFFIFLILVFVHFTITPIFKFDTNDKGLVNLTNTGDGQLIWKNAIANADEKGEFKNPLNCNYTISMDILVKNQLSMTSTPKVILYRSESPVAPPRDKKASDLFDIYPDTNLLVYIDAEKNDLNVVAVTMDNTNSLSPEGIPPISNISLETPFRLTIVFQPAFMEVYLNGQLQATRIFIGRPKETTGTFYAPSEFVRESVRVANLQYWSRTLSPSEIQSSGPVLPSSEFFVVKV